MPSQDLTFVGALLLAITTMAGAVTFMFKMIIADKDKQIERERTDQAAQLADKDKQIERLQVKLDEVTKILGDLAGPITKLLDMVQDMRKGARE